MDHTVTEYPKLKKKDRMECALKYTLKYARK
jgi:hypothetical protein